MPSLLHLSGTELQDAVNASRFDDRSSRGFYESYFVRANHATKAQAFWIRYTIFGPAGHLEDTEGQLWAIFLDGSSSTQIAVKQSLPWEACSFSRTGLRARIGESTLDRAGLAGTASDGANRISWNLAYAGDESPAFLLPRSFYGRSFPRAKALTGIPLADFHGTIHVNDNVFEVDNWRGSQNHNWGVRHTDRYAWGQVGSLNSTTTILREGVDSA